MPKGKYSFSAGGKYNFALGTASHVEGYKNTAAAAASHAEGQKTISIGDYSHSQGLSTSANGDCSHAEGAHTQTGIPIRPCELTNLNPKNQTLVIDGLYEKDYENNDKIIVTYLSRKKRYRARRRIKNLNFDLDKNQTSFVISPPITGQPVSLKVSNQSKGRFSHAQGYETKAVGETSTAIGKNITVTGDTSVGIQLNKEKNNILSQDNALAIVGGKVGIDTLNPKSTLDVNGNLRINEIEISSKDETLSVNGNLKVDKLKTENIEILENTIRSTNENGDLILSSNNEGKLVLESNKIQLGKTARVTSPNQHAQSSTFFVEHGDAQISKYFLIKQTSNSNLVTMTFDGKFENNENIIKIPDKSTWIFNASIVAYCLTNNYQAAFNLRGALGNNGSNTKFIGKPIVESFYDDFLKDLDVKLDCSTNYLKIKISGVNNTVIKWHSVVSTNEICHVGFLF